MPTKTTIEEYLPDIAVKFLKDTFTKKCYQALLIDYNFSDSDCVQLAFSKVLGMGIVVGSGLVKIPQIIKIMWASSTKGISFMSYFLETVAYAITLSYNYRNQNPFTTYGEIALILGQNFIVIFLMFYYSRSLASILLFFAFFAAFNFVLYEPDLVNAKNLALLQAATIPVSIASKLPQIYQNFIQGSTGQLSAFTTFLFFAGSTARVFTTLKEVKDNIILAGFVLGSVFNGILVLQMLYYWNAKPEKEKIKVR